MVSVIAEIVSGTALNGDIGDVFTKEKLEDDRVTPGILS
jgi:hypothetical protein